MKKLPSCLTIICLKLIRADHLSWSFEIQRVSYYATNRLNGPFYRYFTSDWFTNLSVITIYSKCGTEFQLGLLKTLTNIGIFNRNTGNSWRKKIHFIFMMLQLNCLFKNILYCDLLGLVLYWVWKVDNFVLRSFFASPQG